jgi:hypothetical protein
MLEAAIVITVLLIVGLVVLGAVRRFDEIEGHPRKRRH